MRLAVQAADGGIRKETASSDSYLCLVYEDEYQEGDAVLFTPDRPGFYWLRLEDTLEQALVYAAGGVRFPIPFGPMLRICYPPRSFDGTMHLLTAEKADAQQVTAHRNLALNPYDTRENTSMFPHAHANVETRGEALFAARNAIDGIRENHGHYPWPYQSWGIDRDPNAELTVEFGLSVDLDELRITLRADFPHDSYWTQGTVSFSDGSEEVLSFQKSDRAQCFPVDKRGVTWLKFGRLIKHEDGSPFPALTQLEAWGHAAKLL